MQVTVTLLSITNTDSMTFSSLIVCLFLTISVQLTIQASLVNKEDLQVNTTIGTSSSYTVENVTEENNSVSNGSISTGSSNGARDPKFLSLFQNLLRFPLSSAQNQYQGANTNTAEENHYYKQDLQQQQQNYYHYDPGQTQSSPLSSSSTNIYHTMQTPASLSNQLSGQTIPKFAFGDLTDLSSIANLLSFGTMEGIVERVNKFDQLKCIPKMMCQMVAKRQEDAERDSTSTTTTTTTRRPASRDSNSKEERSSEDARFIKFQGVDTALEQVVKFLDIMQLKDWSFYPYLQGVYEGQQVKRSDECLKKYSTCPFNDDQLVYYFNNYNGGFFQSFRSHRKLHVK